MATCNCTARMGTESLAQATTILDASFGGYNCSFVEEPDQTLYCLICARVLREPELTDCCGNHYCASCLRRWLENSAGQSCPLCRKSSFNTLRDKKTERTVQGLQVWCKNRKPGCSWTGELRDLHAHLKHECSYILVECTNGCGDIVQRKELPVHLEDACFLRRVQCEYCGLQSTFEVIASEHYEECPKVPIACPNACCSELVLRENMDAHIAECPLEKVSCQFSIVGCQAQIPRRDVEAHMVGFQSKHLLKTLASVTELQKAVETCKAEKCQLQTEVRQVRSEHAQLKQQLSTSSPSTACTSRSTLNNQVRLSTMEMHLQEEYENTLDAPFLPCIIKMENFDHWKYRVGPWFSTPFYTSTFGYKLCLCVYANGCCTGDGTHLSVYVHVMRGEFDAILDWPIEMDISVELQNQHAESNHLAVECNFDSSVPRHVCKRVYNSKGIARRGTGTPTFIELSGLSRNSRPNCQYLKNNCLYFYVY